MFLRDKLQRAENIAKTFSKKMYQTSGHFLKQNRVGLIVIGLATLIFFAPLLSRLGTYSGGGDAMFNAWTLARNHHCILQQDCPNYADGNIYFPNKDSMLYSETQLSTGLLTLPIHFVDKNPILAHNIWTILSMFLSGLFMYMLAKALSKKQEFISIAAGLIFEFAPVKMTALGHLQNLSIFYLPLIVLIFIKILQSQKIKKSHLIVLFVATTLLFYASWYQMVFALMAIAGFVIGLLLFRLADLKKISIICGVVLLSVIATLPLAKEYTRFSKTNQATFALPEQVLYSASLKDYAIPYNATYEGEIYNKLRPQSKVNSFNPDSSSFHGFSLYIAAFATLVLTFGVFARKIFTKKEIRMVYVFAIIGLIGFIVSLGPLLKVGKDFAYSAPGISQAVVIPLPYIIVDKLLPQLSFIRAIGRASIIFLFALCCIVAIGSRFLKNVPPRAKFAILAVFGLLIFFELSPRHMFYISPSAYSQNLVVPSVYKFVAQNKGINNLVILRSDRDYPGAAIPIARAEDVLWAGYHNRNIFNGYSGYEPKAYGPTYGDFVDFDLSDIEKMKTLGLQHIIIDKQLSTSDPSLVHKVEGTGLRKLYEDDRYVLFKI